MRGSSLRRSYVGPRTWLPRPRSLSRTGWSPAALHLHRRRRSPALLRPQPAGPTSRSRWKRRRGSTRSSRCSSAARRSAPRPHARCSSARAPRSSCCWSSWRRWRRAMMGPAVPPPRQCPARRRIAARRSRCARPRPLRQPAVPPWARRRAAARRRGWRTRACRCPPTGRPPTTSAPRRTRCGARRV